MAEGADPESKTEEASPRKLEEARKKGDVAKSPDVAAAMSLAGAAAVLLLGGGYFSQQMAEHLLPFTKAVVPMVDIAGGRVTVVPPDEIIVQPQPGEDAE